MTGARGPERRNILRRGTLHRTIMRRVLMATVVVMFAGLGVFLAEPWSQASPAGAVDPGTYPPYPAPGVPAEPIYIWNEDFEETQASAPVALQNFVGKAGAIYSADPTWESTAGLCNGWIVGASGAFSSTSDAGCKTNGGKDYTNSSVNNITTASNVFANGTSRYSWDFLRYQAYVLGLAQMGIGPSAAEMPTITSTSNSVLAALPAAAQQAMGNHVLASETNNGTMTSGQTLQFKAVDVAPAQMGHYYLTSAYFAAMHSPAVNSTWKAPSERFVLTAGTQQWQIAAGINPFTSSTQYSSTVLAPWVTNAAAANGSTITTLANLRWYPGLVGVITLDNATAVQVGAQAFQADAANGAVTLGIEIHNDVLDTTGNDLAIDNPAIIDVTPRLDKSFSPNLIQPGGTSQMSLWITNTTDLVAKPGWNFTDVLPSGVVLDGREPEVTVQCFASGGGAAVASGTCSLADGSCNGLSVAPVPGSGGTASRTFSITASASGTESTGAEDTVTVSGGLADNDAYCTVTLGVINNAITEDQQATLDSGERVPFINTVNTGTPGCADSSAGKLAADLGVPAFTTGSAYGLAGCPFAVLKVEEPNLKVDIAPPVISHLGSDETAPLPLCTDSTTTLLTWNIAVLNAATTTSGSNPDDASGLPADDTGSSPGSDAVNVIVTSDVGDNLTGASWGTPPIGVIATYHTTGGDGQDGRTASVTYSDRNGVQTVSVRPRGEIQDGATVWFIAALPAGQTETVQVSAFVVHQGDTSDTNAGTTCGITNTELTDAANPYVNTVTVTSHDYQQYCSPSLSGVKPGNPICRAYDDPTGVQAASLAADSDRWDQEQTILPKPSITLTKTADTDDDGQSDAGSVSAVGDPIDYFVTITNTGPVALDMTSILDDFLTNNSPPDSFTCPFYPAPVTDQVLDPGEAVVCTGQHLTTETDLTNGYITNLASTLADPVYNASYAALASCPVGSTTNDAGIIPSPGCPATTSTYTYPNLVDAQDAVSVFVDLPFVPPVINDLPLTGWDHPFPFEAVGTTLALTAIATFLITTRRRIAVT